MTMRDPLDPGPIFEAFARGFLNNRPQLSPEAAKAAREKAHREDPRHKKALAKRRKRKRGGPK